MLRRWLRSSAQFYFRRAEYLRTSAEAKDEIAGIVDADAEALAKEQIDRAVDIVAEMQLTSDQLKVGHAGRESLLQAAQPQPWHLLSFPLAALACQLRGIDALPRTGVSAEAELAAGRVRRRLPAGQARQGSRQEGQQGDSVGSTSHDT